MAGNLLVMSELFSFHTIIIIIYYYCSPFLTAIVPVNQFPLMIQAGGFAHRLIWAISHTLTLTTMVQLRNFECFTGPGLAGFCQAVEKNVFFHGKNRAGKNRFLTIFSILFTMNVHVLLSIYCQRLCDD